METFPLRLTHGLMPSVFNGIFSDIDEMLPGWKSDAKLAAFPLDVKELNDSYLIHANVPGVTKENIDVVVENGRITISVKTVDQKDEKNSEGRFIHRERRSVESSRSIALNHVTAEGVEATLKDGILTLKVKKDERRLPKKIEIGS